MVNEDTSRRRFIEATAVTGIVGLAGCSGSNGGGSSENNSNGGGSSENNSNGGGSSENNSNGGGSNRNDVTKILHSFDEGLSLGGLLYYPIQWGNELGFYEEENVAVNAFLGMGGGASTQQLSSGNFQVSSEAMDSIILARAKQAKVRQICTWQTLSHGLVAQKKYKSFNDLPEKIDLGISNPTSGSTGSAYLMLTRNGISTDNINLISIGGSQDRYLAVKHGDVDVGASVADVALIAENDKDTRILEWAYKIAPKYYFEGLSVYSPWLKKSGQNYKAAVHHTTATLRTIDYAFNNRNELKKWAIGRDYLDKNIADQYMKLAFGKDGFQKHNPSMEPSAIKKNNIQTLQTIGALEGSIQNPGDIIQKDVYKDAVTRLEDQYGISLPDESS